MRSVREREDISGVSQIVCRNYVSVTTFLFRLEHFNSPKTMECVGLWGFHNMSLKMK